MRIPGPLPLLLLAACGSDTVTVRGTLDADAEATEVWVAGATDRARVAADSFFLQDLQADSLDLRFAAEGREVARMRLAGLPPGAEVRLQGIWIEDDVAFPERLELTGGGVVTVNGLRMSVPDALPQQVDQAGMLLALGDDALLLRPSDPQLADLRVVITPGTVVRSADGEPAELDGVEFGDSLRVVGTGEQGYVVAAEVVLPRDQVAAADPVDRREPSAAATPASPRRSTRPVAEPAPGGRGKGAERGRGKGKGKGKGRD